MTWWHSSNSVWSHNSILKVFLRVWMLCHLNTYQSVYMAEICGDKQAKAEAKHQIGLLHQKLSQFDLALQYQTEFLEFCCSNNDEVSSKTIKDQAFAWNPAFFGGTCFKLSFWNTMLFHLLASFFWIHLKVQEGYRVLLLKCINCEVVVKFSQCSIVVLALMPLTMKVLLSWLTHEHDPRLGSQPSGKQTPNFSQCSNIEAGWESPWRFPCMQMFPQSLYTLMCFVFWDLHDTNFSQCWNRGWMRVSLEISMHAQLS